METTSPLTHACTNNPGQSLTPNKVQKSSICSICSICEKTAHHLINLEPKKFCIHCIESLGRENRIVVIDDANASVMKKYDKLFGLNKNDRIFELNQQMFSYFYNDTMRYVFEKNNYLYACCLGTTT